MEAVMNLLSYTKRIAEKINFYDEIAKSAFSNFNLTNPFVQNDPINITIIWIEGDDDRHDY